MDEWDNLILPKERPVPAGAKVNLAELIPKDVFEDTEKVKPLFPELKKKGAVRADEASQKTISPYVPILPVLWSAQWANKFATLALAFAMSFGIYSYSGHISQLGFKGAITGTETSFRAKLVTMLGGTIENNRGQLAAPATAVIVLEEATTTTQ